MIEVKFALVLFVLLATKSVSHSWSPNLESVLAGIILVAACIVNNRLIAPRLCKSFPNVADPLGDSETTARVQAARPDTVLESLPNKRIRPLKDDKKCSPR